MPRQNEFNLRLFTSADSEAVVQTLNSASMQSIGVRQAVVDAVGNVRLNRYVPLNSEKIVVTNQQDEIVGYAYLANKEANIIY